MENYKFKDKEGKMINYYKWSPQNGQVIGVVQISHGMTETALRYSYFAESLIRKGFVVYAHDHRGHGNTAKDINELGYIADNDGFNLMVDNIAELTDIIRRENVNLPIILFGHSMGSFLSQRYLEKYGDKIDGLILSGSNGKPKIITKVGILISKCEMMIRGRKAKSKLMDKLSFGDFNNNFKPVRTKYDWLCSVNEEVDKYINDEKCGFVCTTSFYYDLIKGLWDIHKESNKKLIRKDIPIYIFAGDKDPVGEFGKGILNLYNFYKDIGVQNVKYKLYKEGRHEMLNEGNKDEVISDINNWLKDILV